MTDTVRTKTEVLGILPLNSSGLITPQNLRDFTVSIWDRVGVNVRDYGAIGDGAHEPQDTAGFLAAITALKAGSGKQLFVPPGSYNVDGDAVLDALYNLQGWDISGAGANSTIIIPKTSSSIGFGWETCRQMTVRGIAFKGSGKGLGKTAFKMLGNGTVNTFIACDFHDAQKGFETAVGVKGGGTPDQNERNTFLACNAYDSTEGFYINSTNSQAQLFLGGGASSCGIGFHGSAGWASFYSFSVPYTGGPSGTGWKLDSGWISTALYGCIDEGLVTSVDLQSGNFIAEQCYFQGNTDTIKSTSAYMDCRYCQFNTGKFTAPANAVFYDRQNVFSGVTFDPGVNAVRHRFSPDGYRLYYENGTDNWSVHKRFDSAEGYSEIYGVTAPASPPAGYLRVYQDGSSGKMTAKDSGGTTHDFY